MSELEKQAKTTEEIITENIRLLKKKEFLAYRQRKWVPLDVVERALAEQKQKLQELVDSIPMEMVKIGKKYEVYSIGTKKAWIEWFVRYNLLFGKEEKP